MQSGKELRLKVAGIVGSFDHDGRVAYVPAKAMLRADPLAPEELAIIVKPGANQAAVRDAVGPSAIPASGAIGRGVTQAFNTWVDRALVPAVMPVIVADVHERVDPADDAFFRQQFEGFLKCTLEESRARRPQALERLQRVLEPMQAVLKRQPFVCGTAPAYADYILFSVCQWMRVTSPQDIFNSSEPVYLWRNRMLDLYDGFARNIPTA